MLRKEASNTLRLAFPIIIGELAQMALHIIDTAMVGAISYKQLAAASLVINALNIPFVIGILVLMYYYLYWRLRHRDALETL